MKALVSGGDGFQLLSKVLIIILQTLLQDRLAEVAHNICGLVKSIIVKFFAVNQPVSRYNVTQDSA